MIEGAASRGAAEADPSIETTSPDPPERAMIVPTDAPSTSVDGARSNVNRRTGEIATEQEGEEGIAVATHPFPAGEAIATSGNMVDGSTTM